jgi:mono/diheme cytochrome c family protein
MRFATVWLLLLAGCSALAPSADPNSGLEPPSSPTGVAGGGASGQVAPPTPQQGVAGTGGRPGFDNPFMEPVRSEVPPAPINGGTLLIAKDGHTAIASDPDRDRVSIADLARAQVLGTIEFDAGDEPGRGVEDQAGRVHIVLRKRGEVATISLATRVLLERRHVCQVPQGIAHDAARDEVLVACSEGELVALPAAGGQVTRRAFIDSDLRDVIVTNGRRYVSRFKSAELLEIDGNDKVVTRSLPGQITGPFDSFMAPSTVAPGSKAFDAVVAWRTVALADGRVMMLHQRAQATPIALALADGHVPMPDGAAGGGGAGGTGGGPSGSNPYGGSDMCDSIVRPALSASVGPGEGLQSGPVLPAATLAVDVAVSSDRRWVAVAVAGSRNGSSSMLGQVGALVLQVDGWNIAEPGGVGKCQTPGFDTNGAVISAGQVVGVAFDGANRLVMQTREPNRLRVVSEIMGCIGCTGDPDLELELGGLPRRDTGHDLFHEDAGAGLACASCHPSGADDGHTWVFEGIGARRTQLFNMGIGSTLPLHWDGEFADFNALVDEVFERRMGGPELEPVHVDALATWIETLQPNSPMRAPEDAAAQRGKALFESAEVGCASCHSGALLTNNTSVDVGTGGAFQVPSLVGVAYHQPYMHTGCAQSLRQRFDPGCGGDKHGNTGQLSSKDLDDLVAYLETL